MKKTKIKIGLSLLLGIITLLAVQCKKENIPMKPEIKKPVKGAYLSSCDPENIGNPYDSIGGKHNQLVSDIYNWPNFDNSFDSIVFYFNETTGLNYSSQDFTNYYNNYFVDYITTSGGFDVSYFDQFQTDSLVKVYLKDYFTLILTYGDLCERVSESINFEDDVINDSNLTSAQKERLLMVFSVYRHSTYLWETDLVAYRTDLSDIYDAIATDYCIDNCDVSCAGECMPFAAYHSMLIGVGL